MDALSRPVDPRGLHFTPLGLGGAMAPEVAERLIARECARLELPEVVTEAVRGQFAAAVRQYADGLFRYENYTSACREAYRVLEVALKQRFIEHHAGGVPLLVGGVEEVMHPTSFEQVRARLLQKGVHLRGHRQFRGSFGALLAWARREGYFAGQRNRVREPLVAKIRNEEMHSEFPYVFMPPDALRRLRDVSELVARLWGGTMPSRRLHPGTIDRMPLVLGTGPLPFEGTHFAIELLPQVRDEQGAERIWYMVLAAFEENFMWWTPDTESTSTPVTVLWGPGSWQEMRDAVARLDGGWQPDSVRVIDRTFYIRVVEGTIDPARSAAHALALRAWDRRERWSAVLADSPFDARKHVRRVLAGACRPQGCGCPVTVLFSGAHRDTVVRHARFSDRVA